MLLSAIVAIGLANAAPSSFGAGVSVGDTTGLSLGYRPTEWNAVEMGLGWDALDSGIKGSADYLQSVVVIDPSPKLRIPVYIGLGADVGRYAEGGRAPAALGRRRGGRAPVALGGEAAGYGSETGVSARVPLGASILFMNAPVEVFGHVIPQVRVVPDRQVDVDGTLGFRYYF